MSSLAASVAGLCVKVWSVIVGVFLFIPRFVHNLAVRPDDDNDHGGGHLLVWEFGQVRCLLDGCLSLGQRTARSRSRWASASLPFRHIGICRPFCAHSPSRRGTWMTSCGSRCSRATSDGTIDGSMDDERIVGSISASSRPNASLSDMLRPGRCVPQIFHTV